MTTLSDSPFATNGAYRWIKDACDLLKRAAIAQGVPGSALGADIDEMLSGVPCPQVDLGFDSPADRAARSETGISRPVWEVHNRTSSILCATEEIADAYMSSFSPAVGMNKSERFVLTGKPK